MIPAWNNPNREIATRVVRGPTVSGSMRQLRIFEKKQGPSLSFLSLPFALPTQFLDLRFSLHFVADADTDATP